MPITVTSLPATTDPTRPEVIMGSNTFTGKFADAYQSLTGAWRVSHGLGGVIRAHESFPDRESARESVEAWVRS